MRAARYSSSAGGRSSSCAFWPNPRSLPRVAIHIIRRARFRVFNGFPFRGQRGGRGSRGGRVRGSLCGGRCWRGVGEGSNWPLVVHGLNVDRLARREAEVCFSVKTELRLWQKRSAKEVCKRDVRTLAYLTASRVCAACGGQRMVRIVPVFCMQSSGLCAPGTPSSIPPLSGRCAATARSVPAAPLSGCSRREALRS